MPSMMMTSGRCELVLSHVLMRGEQYKSAAKNIFKLSMALIPMLFCTATYAGDQPKWSGGFVGVGAGYDQTDISLSYKHTHFGACVVEDYGDNGSGTCGGNVDFSKGSESSKSSFSGGVRLGRNWLIDSYVVGIVGEASLNSRVHDSENQIISTSFGDTLNVSVKQSHVLALRALFGKPYHQFLPYVTGGVSSTKITTNVLQSAGPAPLTPASFESSETEYGFIYGGGIKMMTESNWVLGLEYLRTNYGHAKLSGAHSISPQGIHYPDTASVAKLDTNRLQVTLDYLF